MSVSPLMLGRCNAQSVESSFNRRGYFLSQRKETVDSVQIQPDLGSGAGQKQCIAIETKGQAFSFFLSIIIIFDNASSSHISVCI